MFRPREYIRWSLESQWELPDEGVKQAESASATRSTTARSDTAATHPSGTAERPPAAPSRFPVIAPVESESPEWLTAASTAASNVAAVRAQYTAMARASSATHPSPNVATASGVGTGSRPAR